MANKYASNAKAILLNNGTEQLLPVSKAKLIELAKSQQGQFGKDVVDVEGALSYLLGQDETNLTAAKEFTTTSINGLDSTITADNGYVLTGITETDGKLTSYTQTRLDASVVTYNGGEDVNNVGTALTDIYGKLAAISGTGTGSIKDQINAAIQELDVNEIKEAGKAIVSVSEADGKIAATAGNIKAQCVDVDNDGDKFKIGGDSPAATLTTQATLEHLQSEIKAVENAAAKYSVSKITENLPANVGARYQLMQSIGGAQATPVEATIDIPADSSLKEVYLGSDKDTVDAATGIVTKNTVADPQSMNFVYHLNDGTYSLTKIDVSKFLTESEFKDGLQVDSNGVVSVKGDATSEEFLTVGADGVKLSGVKDAINTAKIDAQTYADNKIKELDSKIDAKTEHGFSYVMTSVKETDGKLTDATYIGLTDENVKTITFNSESDLYKLLGYKNLPTDLHDALNKIAGKISDNGGNAVTSVIGDSNNTYVNISAAKSGNDVTLTVDDSALGNVAKLHYDDLGSVEVASIFNIFNSKPEQS